jgi:hypothetical protein
MNNNLGTFPFGNPVLRVQQTDRIPKPVFILGVYSSAVFAQFKPANSKSTIKYLPIDNEPEIFWSGDEESAKKIISKIIIPKHAGRLIPELSSVNGILGRSLDKYYLIPLKLQRENVWICNLIPHVVLKKNERKSIKRYNEIHSTYNFPVADIPSKKDRWEYLTKKRFKEIIEELSQSKAGFMISLGQQPLKWFLQQYDHKLGNLLNGQDYGSMIEIQIETVKLKLIPLFHPRQLLKEKNRDTRVGLLHFDWLKNKAKKIKLL